MSIKKRGQGQRGQKGAPGERGERGEPGPAGPSATRADILAVVQDEFTELRKHMQVQIERMAQMQLQLDSIQALVKQLLTKA